MKEKIKSLTFGDILGIFSLVITLISFIYWFGFKSAEWDLRITSLEKNSVNSELILYRLNSIESDVKSLVREEGHNNKNNPTE